MCKIELLVKALPHFYIYGFSGNKHWLPHEDLLPSCSCPKWICLCLMRLELIQKASHTEDIPKASLMSDKIIPVPEGFPTFFTFMGLFSRMVSLLCSVMGLGFTLKVFPGWGYAEGFLEFGDAGAYSGLLVYRVCLVRERHFDQWLFHSFTLSSCFLY